MSFLTDPWILQGRHCGRPAEQLGPSISAINGSYVTDCRDGQPRSALQSALQGNAFQDFSIPFLTPIIYKRDWQTQSNQSGMGSLYMYVMLQPIWLYCSLGVMTPREKQFAFVFMVHRLLLDIIQTLSQLYAITCELQLYAINFFFERQKRILLNFEERLRKLKENTWGRHHNQVESIPTM